MKKIQKPVRPGGDSGEASGNKERPWVLYVEDEPGNRKVAEMDLGRRCELLFAANDQEACACLTENGARLSIILMDIELQDSRLNGIALTRLIRGKYDREKAPEYARNVPVLKIPILFLTAFGRVYDREFLLQAGAQDIIEKPVDLEVLHAAIDRFSPLLGQDPTTRD